MPQYRISVEKAKATEAIVNLKALDGAMELYKIANGGVTTNFSDLTIDLVGEKVNESRIKTKDFSFQIKQDSKEKGYELIALRNESGSDFLNYYIYYSYNGFLNCVARTQNAKKICMAFCLSSSFTEENGSFYCVMK